MIMNANKYLWRYKSMHIYTYGLAPGSIWNEPQRDDLTIRGGNRESSIQWICKMHIINQIGSFCVTKKCPKKESSNLFTKLYDSNKQEKKYNY